MATQNTNIVRPASFKLSTVATSTRQTPKTDFGTVMRTGLLRASQVAVDGLQVAAPFIPGSTIVSAALAGGNRAAGMMSGNTGLATVSSGLTSGAGTVSGGFGGNGAGSIALPGVSPGLSTPLDSSGFTGSPIPGGSTGNEAFDQMMAATRQMAEFNASFNLQYLQLQEKIQVDTRQFNLISNIMKTKHDAAKNALNNVR